LGVDWALAEVVVEVTGLAEVSGLLNNPGMGGTAPGGSKTPCVRYSRSQCFQYGLERG